jgi:hypothetical protein
MKSMSYTIQSLYRLWLRWTSIDYRFRLARRNSRASGWTTRGFTIEFRRQDYAVILKACHIMKQSNLRFLEEAALERAHLILQMQNSGGSHESRVN